MSFGMPKTIKQSNYNRERSRPGEHVCTVEDVREFNGRNGRFFYIDLIVVEGPSGAGFKFTAKVAPDKATGGNGMTPEEAQERDWAKLQRWVAACAGLPRNRQTEMDNERFATAIARPKSCLAGRKVIVKATAHTNKAGEESVYYDLLPYLQDGQGEAVISAPGMLPPPPVAAVSFEQAMATAGYVVHPQSPVHAFRVVNGQAVADSVVLVADLRKQLGF